MNQKLKEIFCKSKYEPRVDLAEDIWRVVLSRNKRITNFKLIVFSVVGFASLLGLVPAIKMLLNDLGQSGFYEYLSLAFSSITSITSYWKEFAFSLAESLPLLSTILSLSLIFVFFLSVRYAMKQIIKGQLSLSF